MRQKIVRFMERLGKAVDQGWVFDLPSFPQAENQVGHMKNSDNVIVDGESPVFLDVEAIWNAREDFRNELQNKQLDLSCQIALDLLRNQISLDDAFTRAKKGDEKIISSFVNSD